MLDPLGFDDAALGRGLPPAAAAALAEAGAHREDGPRAMAALMRARALAPDHPAVWIAFYRHHFFGHRLHLARAVARQVLHDGARAIGLPTPWRAVPPRPLAGADTDAGVRLYLFALKGYAYLSLRLRDLAEAGAALDQLAALDPDDRVGGALLARVLQRALHPAPEDEEDALHA